jgi:hypothetical protein
VLDDFVIHCFIDWLDGGWYRSLNGNRAGCYSRELGSQSRRNGVVVEYVRCRLERLGIVRSGREV